MKSALLAITIGLGALAVSPSETFAKGLAPASFGPLVQAGGCFAIGQAQAANAGGVLSSADEAVQNGAPVCRIVIVIPASDGNRARRVEMIVPRN